MVEQINKTIVMADDEVWKEISSKRAFQDSYDYLRDRYNLKSSYSNFEKNCLNKGFLHDNDDFELIVMSVLVGMGRIDDAYTEANVQSDNYINELENELEQLTDELGEELTQNEVLASLVHDETPLLEFPGHVIKLTIKEKAGFVLQAIKEAFHKTFK